MANEKEKKPAVKTKSEKESLKKSFRLIKSETPKTPPKRKKKTFRFPFFPDLSPAA